MVKAIFEPDGRRVEARAKESLLKIAQQVGITIRSECGGKGTCGKCRLQVSPKQSVTPPTSVEKEHLTVKEMKMGYRLACQALVTGDLDVQLMVPRESRITKRRLQIEGITNPVTLRPVVHAVQVSVPPVDPTHPVADDERLIEGLRKRIGGKRGSWVIPMWVTRRIPEIIRESLGQVTVTLWDKRTVIDVNAGDTREDLFGVALDIGTSKLVASLHSLVTGNLLAVAGLENPQIRHGEDIMSRLSFAAKDPTNRAVLQNLILDSINLLLARLAQEATISLDHIYELVVVGNTVMTSLFLGLDTKYLGYGPFTAPARGYLNVSSDILNLSLPPQANVHVLPCIAGYVGADAVADILATGLHRRKRMSLLIDIGTNSEVVLGNREELTACSCAAGPAFEGAQIEHGMKAVSGAIERVSIHPDSMEVEVETVDNKPPIGICGSGVVDAVAQLAEVGLLTPHGRFTDYPTSRLLQDERGKRFILFERRDGERESTITLSEHDVSQLLLAKAAIQTGYRLVLDHHHLSPADLDRVFIAGAFGNYLNPASARVIGLIPRVPSNRVTFVGNAALAGARLALLSRTHRSQAIRLAKTTHFLDLARHPDFNQTYTSSLFLPKETEE